MFGSFPAPLAAHVGGDVDLFISKNTLKRGYIHPEREDDPRMLVHLGCDDETFLASVHEKLKPGGLFLIYNLHPAMAKEDEPYIPRADGRSPFDRDQFDISGFDVIAIGADDSSAARRMGQALAWADQMDLQNDLLATFTLVRRR